jgi:hypothetical protein
VEDRETSQGTLRDKGLWAHDTAVLKVPHLRVVQALEGEQTRQAKE